MAVYGERQICLVCGLASVALSAMILRAALYLAQIRPGRAEIYRDDSVRVDAFDVSPGQSLRQTLVEHGWRPTGQHASGGGWAAILVEPTASS